jgi:hypothetical protein
VEQLWQSTSDERPSLLGGVALTWCVGLAAVLCDFFQCSESLSFAIRVLFVLLTCGSISLALVPRARALAGRDPVHLRLLTRQVSRWVFIALYSLAAIRLGLYLLPGAAVRPGYSLQDFQFYIAACIVPLWVIRAVVLRRDWRNPTPTTRPIRPALPSRS